MIGRGGGQRLPRDGQAGFSLIEVLVAFFIFVLVTGTALSALSGAVRLADTSREYSHALMVAENLLDRAGADIGLGSGSLEGDAGNGYRWQMLMERLPEPARGESDVAAYRVRVRVSWGGPGRDRDVQLQTVKLDPDPRATQ